MATLNTMRTKFGIVLSAVIAFALLAFILSLGTEMGFSGNDPVVGEMNGEKVKYSEYIAEYNDVKMRTGIEESTEEQAATVANITWQSIFSDRVLEPGFEDLGLAVSHNERMGMISGQIPTQAFYSAFADPQSGAYNAMAVQQFLMQSNGNPQAEQAWALLNEQASLERLSSKYVSLIAAGSFVNSLESAAAADRANKIYKGRWAGKRYSALADSLFSVSQSDIKRYYNENKARYAQTPSRTLRYVMFDIDPTSDDQLEIENSVAALAKGLATAEDARAFIRESRYGSIADNYVTAAQLDAAESQTLMAGKVFGPEKGADSWRAAKVISSMVAPDSIGIRHVVLPFSDEELADSLLQTLKSGADFATTAAQYSVFDTRQNGGEVGVMPFSELTDDLAKELNNRRNGDIVKLEVAGMIQLIQVYGQGKRVKQVKVASIDYPIAPSQATINAAHAAASNFAVEAKGDENSFRVAAQAATEIPRSATLRQGERLVSGIADSREIVRWASAAEEGDLSQIFKVEDGYVVAMLLGINNNEFTPLADVSSAIKSQLIADQKFESIKSEMSGSTFDEQSKSLGDGGEFEDVTYSSYYINGLGVEPSVIGAITASEAGKLSEPVKGSGGLYVFEVSEITAPESLQSVDAANAAAKATAAEQAPQRSFIAIEEMADVADLRGEFI